MAEACLALGDPRRAHAEFRRAAQSAGPAVEKAVVWAWHGEVLLWEGRYRRALKMFDAAIGQGAAGYVYSWRGAANMKLGRWHDSMLDLNRACRLDPRDCEPHLWKGELFRLRGKYPQALRELQLVIRNGYHWGLYNRALVKYALRDRVGLAADFASIPGVETAFLRRQLGLPAEGPLDAESMRKVLEAGLARAKGVRRSEAFLRRLWMGKLSRTGGRL
jgi:tetratricopeptide (TPR) repeat protein